MSSPFSSDQLTEASSLPEWVTPYLAGLVDNHASIVVSVARVSDRGIGYRPKHEIRYKGEHRGVFDVLECYCAEHGIEPRITKRSKSSYERFKFVLSSRSDVVAFLEPLRPYLVVQNRAVSLLVETLIPGLNNGAHTERESFLVWMRLLKEFRKASGRANRAKYDYEYFCDEWDLDINQIEVTNYEWVPESDSATYVRETESGDEHKSIVSTRDSLFNGDGGRWVEPYVAALIDVHFDFVISIGKQDSRAVGYKILHNLRYKAEGRPVVRLLEQYFAHLGISPRINEQEDTTYEHYELVISRRDDIRRLLEAVRTYVLVRKQAVDLLLNDILPALEAGAHSEQESFIELMGDIDAFRSAAGRANRSKYDQEYFINRWEVDPE